MKTLERDKVLLEMYADVHYLRHDIKINGTNGGEPIVGLDAIVEVLHADDKKTHKRLDELERLTESLKVNSDLKKSFGAWIKSKPVIGAIVSNPRVSIPWIAFIGGLIGAQLGFHIIK